MDHEQHFGNISSKREDAPYHTKLCEYVPDSIRIAGNFPPQHTLSNIREQVGEWLITRLVHEALLAVVVPAMARIVPASGGQVQGTVRSADFARASAITKCKGRTREEWLDHPRGMIVRFSICGYGREKASTNASSRARVCACAYGAG